MLAWSLHKWGLSPFFRPAKLRAQLLVAMVWLALAAVCTSWNPASSAPWPFNKEEKPGKPDKVVAIWTDTVLTQVDQAPQRGFGGRLMFYEGKSETPVKVEGTLAIYAFDETRRDGNTAKPDRKYVFSPDQLPAHYSKSKIGHSYSVWLPWDEVGGPQKEISLIVRFEAKGGTVAVGQPSRHMLPGQTPPQQRPSEAAAVPAVGNMPPGYPANSVAPAGWGNVPIPNSPVPNGPAPIAGYGGVQPVSYMTPVMPQGNWPQQDNLQARRMTTATIAIPSGMAPGPAITSSPAVQPAGYWMPASGTPQQAPMNSQQAWPGQMPGQVSPPATSPAWPTSMYQPPPQRSRSAPARSRPLGEPFARLTRDHAAWPPLPAGPQSGPGPQPGWETSNAAPAPQQAVQPATR